MTALKILAFAIIGLYVIAIILLAIFQYRLIFYPGKLPRDYKFATRTFAEEHFIKTSDGETINALFFAGSRPEVILYFHGNAGDLSGWQYVADDLLQTGYSLMIMDYRGYGKSTGSISEEGLYRDADACYDFLLHAKEFSASHIIIYGRSIGTGVAVDLASRKSCKALILESPYSSLVKLANEKLPYFFPSLFMRCRFDNVSKIQNISSPLIIIHGSYDTLIPPSHSDLLFDRAKNPLKKVIVSGAGHNDINDFSEYSELIEDLGNVID